ncbi:MAG: DUF2974 domain-containing protein [Kiritimatiellae bacterium]|nr:DUF2974 domain-containing protein [Kiritimatiellia bacterium]
MRVSLLPLTALLMAIPAAADYPKLPQELAQKVLPYARMSNGVYSDAGEAGGYALEAHQLQVEEYEEYRGYKERTGAEYVKRTFNRHLYRGDAKVVMDDRESGFKARVYTRTAPDGSKEVVVAYEGTAPDSAADWATDWALRNNTKELPRQYVLAKALADAVVEQAKKDGATVTFTGHSLGGGLAQYVAATTQCKAYTFNAADPGPAVREAIRERRKRIRNAAAQAFKLQPALESGEVSGFGNWIIYNETGKCISTYRRYIASEQAYIKQHYVPKLLEYGLDPPPIPGQSRHPPLKIHSVFHDPPDGTPKPAGPMQKLREYKGPDRGMPRNTRSTGVR